MPIYVIQQIPVQLNPRRFPVFEMLKLIPMFDSHSFAQKKGLHLLSHPFGCWRTGAIPADSMCNPIASNAAKRFANHILETVGGAITSIAAGSTSHIPTINDVSVCCTSRPNCDASYD